MDTKTARLQQQREDAEAAAEREEEYQTYDGVPLPSGPPADIYASTMPGVGSAQPGSVQRTEEPEEDEEYCGYLLFAGTRIDQPEYCDEPKATCEAHRGWEDQEI